MESDLSLDCGGLISEPAPISEAAPLPSAARPGPPPLPPKKPAPAAASPAVSSPATSSPATSSPPTPDAPAPGVSGPPAPMAAQTTPVAPPPPPPVLAPTAPDAGLDATGVKADSVLRRAGRALLAYLSNAAENFREWVVTSGLWWALSTTVHAVVLSLALLVLGSVVTPAYHSTAPSFEAAVNTEVGPTDIQTFDVTAGAINADELRGDLSVASGGVGGPAGGAAVGGGMAGGSWSPASSPCASACWRPRGWRRCSRAFPAPTIFPAGRAA